MTMHYRRSKRTYHMHEALCGAGKDVRPYAAPPTTDHKQHVDCWRCITLVLGRPLPTEPALPEHDKLTEAKKSATDATQMLAEFLFEFLPGEDVHLAKYVDDDGSCPDTATVSEREQRKLIAKFFGVDEDALESEKQALLEHQRKLNEVIEWARTEGRIALRGA